MPEKRPGDSYLNLEINIGAINLETKAIFAKHLAIMQKAGMSLTESLEIISDSSSGKLKKILAGVLKSVQSGNTLSSSFARYPRVFNTVFVSSIFAGESSGTLDKSLENLALQLEKERELYLKIKGAMLYPIVVLSAAFILGSVLSFIVLPKIIPLFEGLRVNLPFTTRVLISFSHFMEKNGTVVFISLAAFIIFM
ncbi:MAG: type II secretion system F family protein, partial [Patescibacteria group bacterium]